MDSSAHGSASHKQRLTLGFLISFMAICAKRAGRLSKKLKLKPKGNGLASGTPRFYSPKSPLRSPTPKQLLTTISNKAITLVQGKKHGDGYGKGAEDDYGDGGVWQRSILMGDKCQPLDFSGVIYYDSKGNQLDELPMRSPRASPLPGYLAQRRL
ncbi:putative inactive tRNA-specific adenosine deaminase-like protein 3-like isoform X1 [Hibiscus syriacus]|uniref:Inactive tRNA-specific adenosine deaminase-like protein 3-like isoform X1 n=1 Tax=Hibiscus syriacus TaxID=106335 RepID=A0A6A2WW45_HIBSY|nr:uncharacterized protein LOC120181921 [Hibiscus syriacus]KAE8665531.1 putative inactive tRNA-specific adenosine deaminase-like protein 3-like isoform X1 [Hibiscus syriacus]